MRAVAEGRDPAGEKQAARVEVAAVQTMRFGAVVADYIERYAKPRNRSWRETENFLTRTRDATDKWQEKDVRAIGRKDVLDALDAVVARGASIHANRLLAALRRFFAWTVERGILEASPMAGLKPPSPEISRDRILTDAELVAVWKAASEVSYPFGPVVQLLIVAAPSLMCRFSQACEVATTFASLPRLLSNGDRISCSSFNSGCCSTRVNARSAYYHHREPLSW
ncbi:hypothetical protein ASF36_01435 [Methylobacterium sp. Leaf90]|nr:hypothetical protein ASF36_01435 [Methylobacterium sp. Leaf90]